MRDEKKAEAVPTKYRVNWMCLPNGDWITEVPTLEEAVLKAEEWARADEKAAGVEVAPGVWWWPYAGAKQA